MINSPVARCSSRALQSRFAELEVPQMRARLDTTGSEATETVSQVQEPLLEQIAAASSKRAQPTQTREPRTRHLAWGVTLASIGAMGNRGCEAVRGVQEPLLKWTPKGLVHACGGQSHD